VPNLELSWQDAAVTAACLIGIALAIRLRRRSRLATVAAIAAETGTVLALFALWQLAGSYSVIGPGGALARGRWLWHAERVLRMPSETAIQHAFLPFPLAVQAFNIYYASLHFVVLIACLIWLFFWHRRSYPRVRVTVVLFTGLSLLVQLIPVAPPRMLDGSGMIDTAVLYGQSVYGTHAGFNPDQLSAMPSVHVGWALLVAIVVVEVSTSRWRWLALAYPALTTLVVVVTANHFWLDGAVAAFLLALVFLVQRAGRALRRAMASAGWLPRREPGRLEPGRLAHRPAAPEPASAARGIAAHAETRPALTPPDGQAPDISVDAAFR